VLVSPETGDDAAVIVMPGAGPQGVALIQTVDFFTPIVDDAFDWGRIAAANAFSDVYAMGGRPVTALNLVAWPVQELPLELLSRVLEGGAAVAAEAGVTILGGHSIHDPEPKYGMAVTGVVEVGRIVRNSTMRPGDRLFLTKPLGLGVISTAIKAGQASPELVRTAIDVMTALNREASAVMVQIGVSAATDVTGFGLVGHLHIALAAAGAGATLDATEVPFIPGAADLAARGFVPSGTRSNHDFVAPTTSWGDLSDVEQLLLADAQTSGGLLIAVPEERSEALGEALGAAGLAAARIGRVQDGDPGRITLTGRIRSMD
jgi:selenide,water dikinase